MLSKISNETKVGSLAAITITLLILSYNFMVGKDNPLSTSRKYFIYFDSTMELGSSTPLTYNGYKVGQLKKLSYEKDRNQFKAIVEVFTDIDVPKGSHVRIETNLLGTSSLRLIPAAGKELALDGDELLPEYSANIMAAVNQKIAPIISKADSLLSGLNALVTRPSVERTFDQLPLILVSLEQTILEIKKSIVDLKPGVTNSMNNLAQFTNNLDEYARTIKTSLGSFERLSKKVDSIRIVELSNSIEATVASMNDLTNNLKNGKGTLGKLATDDKLYNNMVATTYTLQCLLKDIKAYPEKYLPLPWGKKQRKKAVEKSNITNDCVIEPSDSSNVIIP